MGGGNVDTFAAILFVSFSVFLVTIVYSYPELIKAFTTSNEDPNITGSIPVAQIPVLKVDETLGAYYSPYASTDVDNIFAIIKDLLQVITSRNASSTLGCNLIVGQASDPTLAVYTLTPTLAGLNTPIAVYAGGFDISGNIIEYCGSTTSTVIQFRDGAVGSTLRLCTIDHVITRYQKGTGTVTVSTTITTTGIETVVVGGLNGETITTLAFQLTPNALGPYYDYRGNAMANGFNYGDSALNNSVALLNPGTIIYGLKLSNIINSFIMFEKKGSVIGILNGQSFIQNNYELSNVNSTVWTNLQLVGTGLTQPALVIPPGVSVSSPLNPLQPLITTVRVSLFGNLDAFDSLDFTPAVISTITFTLVGGGSLTLSPKAQLLYDWYYTDPSDGIAKPYIYGTYLQVLQGVPVTQTTSGPGPGADAILDTSPVYPSVPTAAGTIMLNPETQWKERLTEYPYIKNNCPYLPSTLPPVITTDWKAWTAFGVFVLIMIALVVLVWTRRFNSSLLEKVPQTGAFFMIMKIFLPAMISIWTLGVCVTSLTGTNYQGFLQYGQWFLMGSLILLSIILLLAMIVILRFDSLIPTPLLVGTFMLVILTFICSVFPSGNLQVGEVEKPILFYFVTFGVLLTGLSFMILNALELRFNQRLHIGESRTFPLVGTAVMWIISLLSVLLIAYAASLVQNFTNCQGTDDFMDQLETESKSQADGQEIVTNYKATIEPLQTPCIISDTGALAAWVTCVVFFIVLLFTLIGYISKSLDLKDHTVLNQILYLEKDPVPSTLHPLMIGLLVFVVCVITMGVTIQDTNSKRNNGAACTALNLAQQQRNLLNFTPSLEENQASTIIQQRIDASSCSNNTSNAVVITISILIVAFFVFPMLRSNPGMKMVKITKLGYAFACFAIILAAYLISVSYANRDFIESIAWRI